MSWRTTEDLEEYLAAAGGVLAAHAAENTVLLTVAETLRARGPAAFGPIPPVFGWWSAQGAAQAAFLLTPPYPVVVTRLPAAAVQPLADTLAGLGRPVAAVNASVEVAEAFAAAWTARTGATARLHQRHRLHRLGTLIPPRPPPDGAARLATAADSGLLVAWLEAFAAEADTHAAADAAGHIADRISYRGLFLWEADGRPVSLAGVSRQVAGTVRVGPVYTPPALRRRGYAAAVTAAASSAALDRGAGQVLLFTDLANPTSNALYQRLGYQPLDDRLLLSLTT
jgi:predicted GNAT family acetyltransferase